MKNNGLGGTPARNKDPATSIQVVDLLNCCLADLLLTLFTNPTIKERDKIL